jgi:hypothetical protein
MTAEGEKEKKNRYNYPGLAYEGWPTPEQVPKLLEDTNRMLTFRDEARTTMPFLHLVSLEREATAMFDYWNNVDEQGLKFTAQHLFTFNYAYCKFQKYYIERRDQADEPTEERDGRYHCARDEYRKDKLWARMRDSSATVGRTSQSRRVRNGSSTARRRGDEDVSDQRADGLQGL